MRIAGRGLIALLLVGLIGSTTWAQPSASVHSVLEALRAGGNVIVVRHGATHPDQADTDPLNPENVAKQRHLNDKGREQAKAVGAVFKAAGVPSARRIPASSSGPSRRPG